MSCQDLETIINELARGQMNDATSRDKAVSHAASCARCAVQLEDQRTLSAGLRRLAAVAADEQAPLRVEASLLATFREQRAALAPAVASSSLAPMRRWIYVGAGVAAAVAIVMLLSLTAFRTRETQQRAPQASENPGLASRPAPDQPRQRAVQPPASDNIQRKKPATNFMPRPQQANSRTNASDEGKRGANDTDQATETEIATDFFPLMNRESLTQLDGGHVVRVELPRSALMSFGLPMNMDRANERIKADVVVGNDGLARAIRFVR
jgi:hypothetical protein